MEEQDQHIANFMHIDMTTAGLIRSIVSECIKLYCLEVEHAKLDTLRNKVTTYYENLLNLKENQLNTLQEELRMVKKKQEYYKNYYSKVHPSYHLENGEKGIQ